MTRQTTWQNMCGIACDEATSYALDAAGANSGYGKVFGNNTVNMNTFTVTGGSTQFWSVDRGTLTIR